MTENWISTAITLALFFLLTHILKYISVSIKFIWSALSIQNTWYWNDTINVDYDKFSKVKLNYSCYWSKSLMTLIYVVGIYSPCMLKTNIWLVFLSNIPSLVFSGAFHAKHKYVICFAIKHYFFTQKKYYFMDLFLWANFVLNSWLPIVLDFPLQTTKLDILLGLFSPPAVSGPPPPSPLCGYCCPAVLRAVGISKKSQWDLRWQCPSQHWRGHWYHRFFFKKKKKNFF